MLGPKLAATCAAAAVCATGAGAIAAAPVIEHAVQPRPPRTLHHRGARQAPDAEVTSRSLPAVPAPARAPSLATAHHALDACVSR